MRKLEKSNMPLGCFKKVFLQTRCSNTSTKPHARLMHSLATLTFGENIQSVPRFFKGFVVNVRPTRAQRRSEFFRKIAAAPTPTHFEVPAERKLTGAVRRGLERGRVA